jgi:hypothetical protein
MSGNTKRRARLVTDVVHNQTFARRKGRPQKADREFIHGAQIYLPQKAERTMCHLPHRSFVVSSMRKTDSDFKEDTFPHSSYLVFAEYALCAHPDLRRNIYRTIF